MFDPQDVMNAIYMFTGRVKRDENGKVVKDENGKVVFEGGNERWRKVYREAPPLAKRRLVLSWYYSQNKKDIVGNGELNDEFTNVKKAMDETLGREDLKYLIANLGNNPKAVEHYKELLDNLPGDSGEVTREGSESPQQEGVVEGEGTAQTEGENGQTQEKQVDFQVQTEPQGQATAGE